jgi:hypothetical protein
MTMAQKPVLPPPLDMAITAPAPNETEDQRQRRRSSVEEALSSLPLNDKAKSRVSGFVSLFDQTYYAVKRQKDDHPASAAQLKEQLSGMARKCDKLVIHLEGMPRDAVSAWAGAGGVIGPTNVAVTFTGLVSIVHSAADLAEQALMAAKTARAAKRGNPGDAMAASMRETAAFVYKELTGKRRAGRAYDTYKQKEKDTEFSKLLDRIYKAYGLKASARSRARQRRPAMGNNPKK